MMCDLLLGPEKAAQRPSVGWATMASGLHFIVQSRMSPEPRDNGMKAPIRWGGRALRGGPLGLDSARGVRATGVST